MISQEVVEKIKSLSLPEGEYIVFGSAAVAVLGVRECDDIDILVTRRVYDDLKRKGWKEKELQLGDQALEKGVFEITAQWNFGSYNPSLGELLQRAYFQDGIPFASLRDVIEWKEAFGRDKDKEDVKRIRQFLRG